MTALFDATAVSSRLLAAPDLPHRLPVGDPLLLLAELDASGLTGRGGAGFPLARKIQSVRAAGAPAVVVGNGAEGEPASDKDRQLLRLRPQLVLDGLQVAAALTGATEIALYVRPGPDLHRGLAAAIQRRDDPVPVRLAVAASGFVAGQESAVLRALAGGPGLPAYTPVRVSERGLRGRPTLVSNVETLAQLALIARYGAAWFRSAGTEREPGTMLATVRRMDGSAGVVETGIGTPIADLLGPGCGGGVLVGGYHGCWLPSALARTLRMDNASLSAYGASVGAGVLAELPARHCLLVETAWVLRYLALESAGQCGPCRNGLPRIAGAFLALADRTAGSSVLADLQHWSDLVVGRGACAHPDGSVRLVRSALLAARPEVDHHLRGACTASDPRPFLPVPDRPI